MYGLFYGDVPEAIVFVFVTRHDDRTIVDDVAFVLAKSDLASHVAHLREGNEGMIFMPGRMYPWRAAGGSGRSIWHVCDERNVVLSGNVTCIG